MFVGYLHCLSGTVVFFVGLFNSLSCIYVLSCVLFVCWLFKFVFMCFFLFCLGGRLLFCRVLQFVVGCVFRVFHLCHSRSSLFMLGVLMSRWVCFCWVSHLLLCTLYYMLGIFNFHLFFLNLFLGIPSICVENVIYCCMFVGRFNRLMSICFVCRELHFLNLIFVAYLRFSRVLLFGWAFYLLRILKCCWA